MLLGGNSCCLLWESYSPHKYMNTLVRKWKVFLMLVVYIYVCMYQVLCWEGLRVITFEVTNTCLLSKESLVSRRSEVQHWFCHRTSSVYSPLSCHSLFQFHFSTRRSVPMSLSWPVSMKFCNRHCTHVCFYSCVCYVSVPPEPHWFSNFHSISW